MPKSPTHRSSSGTQKTRTRPRFPKDPARSGSRPTSEPIDEAIDEAIEPVVDRVSAVRATARLIRPLHWIKNLFVLAPLLFSGKALGPDALTALLAFAAFSLAASVGYIVNDVFDIEDDRRHPEKRDRPLASGQLPLGAAAAIAVALAAVAVTLSFAVSWKVAAWIGAYLGLSVVYSRWLKHIVLLDLFAIAAFFLLRLLAGAAAVDVRPSLWLLMCGGLLALYLAVSKRQHEIRSVADPADRRVVLAEYSPVLLDQIAVVLIAVTFLSYCEYALVSETARRVGSDQLAYGAPFVLYGLLRYQFLVHQRGQGNPIETVLADRSLIVCVMLWGGYNAAVLYRVI